ncbi:hypothetical protein [Polaribacter glomeratus]|uniref:Outer membrane protein beta-barrel domain-containing protein n=1 Tax=Polaribacter glomeratus TaxID=102 RepID=A0A2S7WVM8_9FLAO|nr:hypothetical protein [Polaribacter glomeratus]PQJ81645.1 hypothetical protein BTO16_03260 [Polaribacter glomeratus]TXD66430.1 hypothetical protein ESX12_06515 [Polaribacter glomeratus]
MKRILLVLVLLCASMAQSQEKTFEKEVIKISKRIEIITNQQKDSLKSKIIDIDKKLETGEITKETSGTLKQEVAAYHARKIEKLVGEQERLLQLLVQDKTNGKIASSEELTSDYDDDNTFTIGNKVFKLTYKGDGKNEKDLNSVSKKELINKKSRRTTTQFVFALGLNNVLNNNELSSLNNSEYKFWQSHFYELGWTWKTRLTEDPSQVYFKYGVSFLWNNLRLQDNRIHVKNGENTEIETYGNQLSESRLRHVQMNFPMHLEWDLSKNKTYEDGRVKDRTNNAIRLGVGGFVGFKLGTRQYLEYNDANGVDIEEVQFNNFNMNTVNYGLSAYLGYKTTSLYVKYDLNPLFKNTETRNISLGLRLDLN